MLTFRVSDPCRQQRSRRNGGVTAATCPRSQEDVRRTTRRCGGRINPRGGGLGFTPRAKPALAPVAPSRRRRPLPPPGTSAPCHRRAGSQHPSPPPDVRATGRDRPAPLGAARAVRATPRARRRPPACEGAPACASSTRRGTRILAWHFEPGGSDGSQRPHLIIAAAIRKDVEDQALRAEYLIALWLLICVVVAIDRRTIKAGRIGLALDGAIALPSATLIDLGFKRGRKRAGYRGDYYTLSV